MRIPVSLLAICAVVTGCNSSVDSPNVDSVVVSSNPTAAAVRLNGEAVGRTPTTIKLDRSKNYELQVGKGGFLTEVSDLKPRLITTSEGIEFGFPATVKVNLTKIPAAGEAGVPAADNPEFKKLSKKALGEDAAAKEGLKADIAATKEAAAKIQAALVVREAASKARLAEIAKNIAALKADKGNSAASAQLAEAELALEQATAEADAARAQAEKDLSSVEARHAALAGSEAKVSAAKANVAKAKVSAPKVNANASDDRLGQLEKTYAAEIKALNESQANSNAAIKALNARADEIARIASLSDSAAKNEAVKGLADLQKALEEQKAAAALANEALAKAKADAAKNSAAATAQAIAKAQADAEKAVAAANMAAEKSLADERLGAEAKLAEANKSVAAAKAEAEAKLAEANKAAAAAMADAEAKVNEANKVAAAAKAQTEALKYSEFNARYALLESRRRAKSVTEEEYKAALSELRKELGL
jgi:hypothetical protein